LPAHVGGAESGAMLGLEPGERRARVHHERADHACPVAETAEGLDHTRCDAILEL